MKAKQRRQLLWWWLGIVLSLGLCGLGFGVVLGDVIRAGEWGFGTAFGG